MTTKTLRNKMLAVCVVVFLVASAFFVLNTPKVKATSSLTVTNMMEVFESCYDFISAPGDSAQSLMANWVTTEYISEVEINVGSFNHDGTVSLTDSETNMQTFINDAHAEGLKAYFAFYNGYGDETMPDCSNPTTIANMDSAVATVLGYGWDGFMSDFENWTDGNTATQIAYALNSMSATAQDQNKVGFAYWGINPSLITQQVVADFNTSQSFIIARFSPIDTENTTLYTDLIDNLNSAIPWMPQIRAAATDSYSDTSPPVLETVQSSINFYTAEFSNGVPSGYRGAALWDFPDVTGTELTELYFWNVWNGNSITVQSGGTFGTTTAPLSDLYFNAGTSRMRGSEYSTSNGGPVIEISAYFSAAASVTINAECALYSASNTSLVKSTAQVSMSLTTSWQLFNFTFTPQPQVAAATQYILLAWVNNTSGSNVYLGSSAAGSGNNADYASDSYSYGASPSWPSTVSLTNYNFGPDCIYATLGGLNYYITVNSAYGNLSPSGWVAAGGTFNAVVDSPYAVSSGIQEVCVGYDIGEGITPGISYSFTNVQSNETITFGWLTNYYLTLNSGHGVTTGQGWYTPGENVTFSVTVLPGFTFVGWAGTGVGSYTGSSNSVTVTMNNPITEAATWYMWPTSSTAAPINGNSEGNLLFTWLGIPFLDILIGLSALIVVVAAVLILYGTKKK
jgi:hypothetical protein